MENIQGLVGQTLGQYRIIEQIGEGGMAVVFKAYQPSLSREVALKVLPPHFAKKGDFSQRFEREAQAIGNLHHPNILAVYDSGQEKGYSYLAMRYIANAKTLTDVMKKPLPPQRIIELISQIAGALDHAHKMGIIHRDIKPSNILMDGDWALLSDFGLAKMVEGSVELTGTGVGMGTPAYMSPEQGMGKKVDHRTDIYALGIILFEMLTGQIPHKAETPLATIMKRVNEPLPMPRTLNPNIPEAAEQVLLKALAQEPTHRFDSAGEMVIALKEAYSDKAAQVLSNFTATTTSIEPKTFVEPKSEPKTTTGFDFNKLSVPISILGFGGVAGLIFLVLVALGGLIYFQLRPARSPITWMYVLDLSKGMSQPFPNEDVSKWESAQATLGEDLKLVSEDINVGLRVFGQSDKCDETNLLVKPNPKESKKIQHELSKLSPSGSNSPLTEGIVQAFNDLELGPDKRNALIILTSGLDSCEPDGADKVSTMVKRLGVRVDTYIVGIAIDSPETHQELAGWAMAAKGVYLSADSSNQLKDVLEKIQENLQAEKRPDEIAIAPTPTPTEIPATNTPEPLPSATETAAPTALTAADAYKMSVEEAKKWQADAVLNEMGTTIMGPLTADGTSEGWGLKFWSPSVKQLNSMLIVNGKVSGMPLPLDETPGIVPWSDDIIMDSKKIYELAQAAGGSKYSNEEYLPMASLVTYPLDDTVATWYVNYQNSKDYTVVFTVIIDARTGAVMQTSP